MKVSQIPVFIYALINPIDGKVFYVGATRKCIYARRKAHINESNLPYREDSIIYLKRKLIKEILSAGLIPEVVLLKTTVLEKASFFERKYCRKYLKNGNILLQATSKKFDYTQSQGERERGRRWLVNAKKKKVLND